MSSFTTPLQTELNDDGKTDTLLAAFIYRIGEKGSGKFIAVPKGFVTDWASVPRILHTVLPPRGRYSKAAVLHDFLYKTHYQDNRKACDKLFYEAMGVLGVKWWKKKMLYRGVRVGGWLAWNKH